MDEFDGADIDAAGRLTDQEHVRAAAHLAADHDLLLVAAGEMRRAQPGQRRAHVEILHDAPDACHDGRAVRQRASVVAPVPVVAEDAALGGFEGGDEAHALAVFRDVAQAHPPHRLHRPGMAAGRRGLPPDPDRAPLVREDAGERLQELGLAVAGDARDTQDLAGADGEARVPDAEHPGAVAHREVLDLEHGFARSRRALLHAEEHAAADHHRREPFTVGVLGLDVAHHPARAHHRDAVGQRHDLAQLVGDQDNRPALVAQGAEDAEELVGLPRREHAGRLVEDEEPGAAVERLQNLHALAEAHRQVADDGVRVDVEAVFPFEPRERTPRTAEGTPQQRAAFHAEHNVFQHREGIDQHEMLMDHADAAGDRLLGVADRRRRAVDPDHAAVGPVIAVDDAHQRRLAGAVLADDAVDRARSHGHRDAVVGMNRAEPLVDADDFERGRAPLPGGGRRCGGFRFLRGHATGVRPRWPRRYCAM